MRKAIAAFMFVAAFCIPIAVGQYQTPPASVQVPYNAAVWNPDAPVRETLKTMDDKLTRIEGQLAALIADKTYGTAPAVKELTFFEVAKSQCFACHTPSTAAKAGDFIMSIDDAGTAMKPFSAKEKGDILTAVETGHMPKKGKLSPVQLAAVKKGLK